MLEGLDKDFSQPISGYWGLSIAPQDFITEDIEQTVQPVLASTDITGETFAPVVSTLQNTETATTATKTNDVITTVGNVATQVIEAIKQQQATNSATTATTNSTNNQQPPTADNSKKTTTIILYVLGGVVVLGTLLWLAFKPSK